MEESERWIGSQVAEARKKNPKWDQIKILLSLAHHSNYYLFYVGEWAMGRPQVTEAPDKRSQMVSNTVNTIIIGSLPF